MKCPSGYIAGTDWNMFEGCEDCCGDIYYYCKNKFHGCSRKVGYTTKAMADREARLQSTKDKKLHSYKCQFCDCYHIGRIQNI